MRVEDARVFEDMHRAVFDLVDRGLVDGLRVDHVDGLADPGAYLAQLKARVGDMPVWIEKILTGTEALPDWPVAGTTGYEAARTIARLLTDADGHAALLARWREETGIEGSFHDAVLRAKGSVIGQDLPAEFHQTVPLPTRRWRRTAPRPGRRTRCARRCWRCSWPSRATGPISPTAMPATRIAA